MPTAFIGTLLTSGNVLSKTCYPIAFEHLQVWCHYKVSGVLRIANISIVIS